MNKRYHTQSAPGRAGSLFWKLTAVALIVVLGYLGAQVDPVIGVLCLVGGWLFFFYRPSAHPVPLARRGNTSIDNTNQPWESLDLRKRLYLDL